MASNKSPKDSTSDSSPCQFSLISTTLPAASPFSMHIVSLSPLSKSLENRGFFRGSSGFRLEDALTKQKILKHRAGEIEYMESLPRLSDVSDDQKLSMFVRKMEHCCLLFDFSDPLLEIHGKEIKQRVLKELVDYVAGQRPDIFPEIVYTLMLKLFYCHVLRTLSPRANPSGEAYDPEEDDPVLAPAWPHLQLVYELFVRFLDSPDFNVQIGRKYIGQSFITQLLPLFDNEDPRERDLLKMTLHRIYGKFLPLRAFIRKSIGNIFLEFIYETDQHNGIAELLEILGSIINGFAQPLKEEHRTFLDRVLIPLHRGKPFPVYYPQLAYCISQYVQKDRTLVTTIILGLIKIWPMLNSAKQVLFLTEIEGLLDGIDQAQFEKVKIVLFRQLSLCITSPHFQVAERALYFWNNYNIVSLMVTRTDDLFPILFPPLLIHAKSHWNKTIRSLALNALRVMMDGDPMSFEAHTGVYKKLSHEGESQSSPWEQLEEMIKANRNLIDMSRKAVQTRPCIQSTTPVSLTAAVAISSCSPIPRQIPPSLDRGVQEIDPETVKALKNELNLRRKSILPLSEAIPSQLSMHKNPLEISENIESEYRDEKTTFSKGRLLQHEAALRMTRNIDSLPVRDAKKMSSAKR